MNHPDALFVVFLACAGMASVFAQVLLAGKNSKVAKPFAGQRFFHLNR